MFYSLKKIAMALCVVALLAVCFSPIAQAQDYNKPIKIGWTAWSDAEAITKIAKLILEEKMGYDVELVMSDIGVQYQALKGKDIDLMLMSWLPVTHQNYWKKYASDVVNLGPLYTRAKLGWVVPDYVPTDKVDSIDDLTDEDVAAKLNNKITGIDPGAGLMQASEKAMDDYGLSDAGYELISSSGAGMTAALARAIKNDDWIVVTGWSPHWKFAKWDLRYIDDPKGILGGRERIHCLAREGFYQDVPYQVFEFFTRMYMPLSELQAVMLEASNTSYKQACAKYVKEHPERVHYWMTGEFK
ncbi:MAG: glycine betaine ABC transporter substrate-binding protein [Desulfovermiculus sp.]|nr:glycine betaine ABC transporter substrate-binding protein [Desulfovermiculus sp.]